MYEISANYSTLHGNVMVPKTGLEPVRRKALASKTSVSTNSTTSA